MAQGIKSDIILNDKMTSVLRDIMKAMDACSQAMDDMEKNGKHAFDGKAVDEFKQAVKQAESSLDGFESGVRKSGEAAEESSSKFEKFKKALGGIGKVGAAVGTAVVASVTAIGAGVAKITKDAVSNYADWEQLVGGIQTLYGRNGAQTIQEFAKMNGKTVDAVKEQYSMLKSAEKEAFYNARHAYETAGMSANEYMEISTGFAAALTDSLGGNTKKAVKYADMAIRDMSDNANKMGTDIELIKGAYQNFAKQNYTMLDNLKIGYGGTKEEMERLLKDASEISGIKYDISSYSDIVDAIHVVQDQMKITGTTEREAATTIQGSLNMTKASYQNLLRSIVTGGDSFDLYVERFVKSLTIFAENIKPVIIGALNGIAALIEDLAPMVAKEIPKITKQVLPKVISAVMNIFNAISSEVPFLLETLNGVLPQILSLLDNIFNSVLSTLGSALPSLMPVLSSALVSLVSTVVDILPDILEAIMQLATTLVQGLADVAPELIPAMVQAVIDMVNSLIENADLLLGAALQLIQALADGLITALPILIAALPQLINSLVNFFLTNLPVIIQAGITLLTALVGALPTIIEAISVALPAIIYGIVSALLNNLDLIINAGITLLTALIDALPQIIYTILAGVVQIVDSIVNKFSEKWEDIKQAGKHLLEGLWEGIKSAKDWVLNKVKQIGSDILGALKGIFKEHSPSKATEQNGVYLMQGLGNGVLKEGSYAVKATQSVAKDVLAAASGLNANAQIGATFTGVTGSVSDLDGGTYDIMRNYAAQDSVNKFTTAQVNIDMGGVVNQIASGEDVDDLIMRFVEGVREKLSTASLGVH